MFGKKKEGKPRSRPAGSLAQYGIFEVPDNFDDLGGNLMGDGDDDLEAELAALTADNNPQKPKRRAVPKPIPDANLDAMVSESLKDINSDEELSGGEDDPELLNELKLMTGDESETPGYNESAETSSPVEEAPLTKEESNSMEAMVKLLEERLALYQKAEKKAKSENEISRARRFGRGVKTLEEMLSHARAGKSVDESEIPPVLPPSATADITDKSAGNEAVTNTTDMPAQPEEVESPKAPAVAVDQEKLELLKKRQQEYKVAAVQWKKAGNIEEAMNHVKIAKQFDIVISALCAGEEVDLSDMPPSPNRPTATAAASPVPQSTEKEESHTQTGAASEVPPSVEQVQQRAGPEDIETALKERLEVYRRTKTAAESEGNASKARRYGRICKQFEDALKLHARGKPVPLDELPVPPGFPPLSLSPQPTATPADTAKTEPEPTPAPVPSGEETAETSPEKKAPSPPVRPNRVKKPNQKITSRADKQLAELQQRQHELKQAALSAKKDGDLELARDYLRQAKGIQPLIEANKSGLPVDMNSVPLSPLAKMELGAHNISADTDESFTLVSSTDCVEEATGTDEQIYENLERQLLKQIKWCLATRDHSKALGDVPGYNRWERLALGYTRDLDMLRVRKRDSLPPPQHHYETKTYAIVQSCTDLNDGDVEISIIRGINYSREADTYVIYEFPYPTDSSPTDRTSTIRGTRNPEYQATFVLNDIIDRSSRQCQRSFRRHALKCQVWSKGCSLNPILCCTHPRGFFRSDSLLGTVTIKLQPLESQCTLHDSFPLMDGRKATGGKLEVKIRLRNPIVTKQIEQITDKWLTIDH